MSLLEEFLAIAEDWRDVFPQARTFRRGVRPFGEAASS